MKSKNNYQLITMAVVFLAFSLSQACSPPSQPAQKMKIQTTKFPVESIHGIFEYTPENKRELATEEVEKWMEVLEKANRIGYRPIPNSEKRALRATFVFVDVNGGEVLKLDQWEDGNISNGNDFFSFE